MKFVFAFSLAFMASSAAPQYGSYRPPIAPSSAFSSSFFAPSASTSTTRQLTFQGGHPTSQSDHRTLQHDHRIFQGDHQIFHGNHRSFHNDHQTFHGNHRSFQGNHQTFQGDHQTFQRNNRPVAILRDDRIQDDTGRFNVAFEAENGISVTEAGVPNGINGAVVKAGQYSYTAPDGTFVEVKYVADENGFQPQSDHLPVAPAFPHPIPQFVLDQIAFAAEEDARRAHQGISNFRGAASSPGIFQTYGVPQ